MRGLRPGWAVKAIFVVIFTSLLFRCVSATASDSFAAVGAVANTNHSVGGASGWDLSSNIQVWANRTTFHVGDSLVFRYTPVHDVLEVKKLDYDMCHTVDPIASYKDGETVIPLREEGNRYFMCGRVGHCPMGLKLHVQVLPPLQITNTTTPPAASNNNDDAISPPPTPSSSSSSSSPLMDSPTSSSSSISPTAAAEDEDDEEDDFDAAVTGNGNGNVNGSSGSDTINGSTTSSNGSAEVISKKLSPFSVPLMVTALILLLTVCAFPSVLYCGIRGGSFILFANLLRFLVLYYFYPPNDPPPQE